MRVPLSWMKEYVDLVLPLKELAAKLTQAGLEVGDIEVKGGSWDSVDVGIVLEVQPHPNADRLRLVTVDLGQRKQTVVCGAPNVAAGQKIAFASVGARLIDGHTGQLSTLKPAKIRGVVSEGMVLSEKELGLSGSHEGILVLPADAPVGAALQEYMGDTVLDVEVTPNRPDWLSILGVTREVAALSGQTVRTPVVKYKEGAQPVSALANVEIAAPDLCARYCATVISGVKIGPSPQWMRTRLEACGMRPINNVVDVTNYVMLEFGQPLHAFDFQYIEGRKIIVRRASEGEAITSLDGISRELNSKMLVIADAKRAVAVAGVMGGLNSEVSAGTTTVLLESANFNQASIRSTGGALNMRSEASMRFERGLPAELTVPALLRATQLIIETAGGESAAGFIDIYPGRKEQRPVHLANREVAKLLGMDVPVETTRETLESLGFTCRMTSSDEMDMTVPYWRSDVSVSADLIEEIARIVGYDKIPTTMISAPIPAFHPEPFRALKEKARSVLVACGLQEIVNYSLVSAESLKKTTRDGSLPGPAAVPIANPMSKEFECLRTSMRPRVLATVASNQRFEERIGLFEIGRVYMPRERDLPKEIDILCCAIAGRRNPLSWRTDDSSVDFFDAKGLVQALLDAFGVEAQYAPATDAGLSDGRSALIRAGGVDLGTIGEVHPRVAENFKASGPVYLFEIDLEKLLTVVSGEFRYEPMARFPAILRDLALVVDVRVNWQDIVSVASAQPLVKQVTLFDVFEGGKLAVGKKSLAFRIVYQTPDHTLTDEEVDKVQQRMLDELSGKLGAALRA